MTVLTSNDLGRRSASLRLAPMFRKGRRAAIVLAATVLAFASMIPAMRFTLSGGFSDPDDAMRLVEVRAFLAGQPWYDVSAHLLDPPFGASMHWSRLIDLPNAALIAIFSTIMSTPSAEALDSVVLPVTYLLLLFWGMLRLGGVLFGRSGEMAAILGTLFGGVALVLFQPGRIGHHAPDCLALVFATTAALASVEPRRSRHAMVAGALVAVSLGFSLETLPMLGALCVAMVMVWIRQGCAFASSLRWFAIGLFVGLPVTVLLTSAPRSWFAPVCDALGPAHVGAGMIGAAGCLALAALGPGLRTPLARLAASGIVGAATLVFVAAAYPACLRSPFAGIDPLVKANWLDLVVESQPLMTFARTQVWTAVAMALPVALGCVASIVAAMATRGTTRCRMAMIAGLSLVGLCAGIWQIRVFASVSPIALCGGLYAADVVGRRLKAAGMTAAASLACVAVLPFTATAWASVLPQQKAAATVPVSCRTPDSLAPLRALPAGRTVAPINEGSHLLAGTALSVFAAPYHRNNDGNRFALDVMLADPADAEALLGSRGVAYLATCSSDGETQHLASQAPGSLAADLLAGRTPAFLRRLPLRGPFQVYAVKPATTR